MKKLIYCAAALATALFAGSCQQELLDPAVSETTVSYTVELPGVQTKAGVLTFAQAGNVDQLVYEVWKTEVADETDLYGTANGKPKATRLYHKTAAMVNGKTTVNLNLVQNQNYKILFWAHNTTLGAYDTDELTAVTYAKELPSEYFSNQEEYAAFYGVDIIDDNSPRNKTMILTRPFGQLNIGTLNTAAADEYTVKMLQSKVVVDNVPTVFNVATSAVSEEVTFTFNSADVPSGPNQNLEAAGQVYEYVAMNYIFANDNVSVTYTIDTEITPTASKADKTTATISKTIPNVPVKENYRTNIVGNLLTNYATYEVVVDADFNQPDVDVKVWDGKTLTEVVPVDGVYMVSTGAELAWISAQNNSFAGKTILLTDNIWLGDQRWTGIGAATEFQGTFDGDGKTIYGLNVAVDDITPVGLFSQCRGVVKNLKIDGAVVNGHYKAGVIVGDGMCAKIENCHVKNASVTITPINNDEGNHAGGIVGYLSAEPNGYVKNCSVEKVTVNAYRDVAAIAGTATTKDKIPYVTGNTVTNVVVIADQTAEYKSDKDANADVFAGRKHANAHVENNQATNVEVLVKVNTVANLERQANVANDENIIQVCADLTGDVMVQQKPNVDVVIDGNEHKYDGTIKIHNGSNYNNATLLIKDFMFETSRLYPNEKGTMVFDFIMPNEFGVENGVTRRYSNNVTVDNCKFTATGEAQNVAVGVQAKSCTNLQVLNCTATNMHSLVQAQSCGGDVVVMNSTINGKNGVAFKQVKNAVVEGNTITAAAYGIRFDGNIDNYGITVKDNNVTAVQPFIVRKMTGANNTIGLQGGNTFTTDETFQIVITSGSDDEAYSVPTGTYTLTGHDGYNVYPVADKESLAAALNNTALTEIEVEGDIESVGEGFEVKRDVVFNFNGQELNAGSTANSYWYAIEVFGDYNVAINDAKFTRAGVCASQGADVVFNSGVINHKPERSSRYIFCAQSGSTITINEGTFKNDRPNNSYFWADNATIYVKGGNFAGSTSTKKVVLSNGGQLIISGGTFNFDPTAWLEEGYVATQNGAAWEVAAANLVTDAASFEAALASGNDGDVIILAPGVYDGTYAVKRSNITIKGLEGAVVDCINLNGAENVTIKNIEFDAAGAAMAYNGGGSAVQNANIITGDMVNKPTTGAHNIVIENCYFTGTYANGGGAVSFTDQQRGGSGDITIKNCTFDTKGGYFDIYAYYSGDNKSFVIEGNTLKSQVYNPVYFGQYQSSVPVVVKDNYFANAADITAAVYLQAHSSGSYNVSYQATGNTFAN